MKVKVQMTDYFKVVKDTEVLESDLGANPRYSISHANLGVWGGF